jgi:hypothetical protein
VRGLIGIYYLILRALLRNQPRLRRHLVRCRCCWIFFLTDPRNAGREDLGCPFGCAALHRSERSDERSIRYNASPVGKAKRHQRREERRRAAVEPVGEAVSPGAQPGDRQAERRIVPPEASSPCVAPSSPASASDEEQVAGAIREAPAAHGGPSCGCSSPMVPAGDLPAVGSGPFYPERIEYAPAMVTYIRVVVSLIEERRVGRAEVIEMLLRRERQHGFARERPIDYVLRWLNEHLANPP